MSATLGDRFEAQAPVERSSSAAAPARLASLDGLRAVAVLLVIGYHAAPQWLPGGFVGVDVFFVLSGFLITALLLRELQRDGRVGLRAFWIRRLRRLAPALVSMVGVIAALTLVVGHETAAGLRRQAFGALTWTSNWVQIHEGWSYADEGLPPVLNHLWSLAIEEQFYLAWPLVFVVLMTLGGRRATRVASVVLVAVSAALFAIWYLTADPTRAYLGLDSHAFGLLLGAALALGRSPHLLRDEATTPARGSARLSAWGACGLVALGLYAAFVAWDSPVTYVGGLVAANVAAAAVVLAAANPTGLARALAVAPLRWLGERSYGLYLWHWPLIVIATRLTPAEHVQLAAWGAVLAAVLAAAASYRFLELPMRRDGIGRTFRRWTESLGTKGYRPRRSRAIATAACVTVLTALFAVWTAPEESRIASTLREGQRAVSASMENLDEAEVPAPPEPQPETEAKPAPETPGCEPVPPGEPVSAFGDSVTVAVAPQLMHRRPESAAVATVGWQYQDVARAIRDANAAGHVRRGVLIATGTNGAIDHADLDALVSRDLAGRQVTLVAPYVPGRSWSDQALATVRAVAEAHPHVHLADWNALAIARPDLTGADRVHPTGAGQGAFLDTVDHAFATC
ncbi:acyltransferase family protein [Aeromicrobium phragmitis]|uniref:acyltransferase family protein n=1 Tax=Aeromicrobium phragmitis TaxID=2478914 RepID=UPI00140E0009|nr:acyltransferase family protein [Aeromicrobium phragmitis]